MQLRIRYAATVVAISALVLAGGPPAASATVARGPARSTGAARQAACTAGDLQAPMVSNGKADVQRTDQWRRFGDNGGGWSNGRGWAAADGTYSVRLPNGLDAWLDNDTFLGPVGADESLPRTAGFIHNSIVLGAHDSHHLLTTVTGGTHDAPESLVGATVTAPPWDPTGTNSAWFWNLDGIVDAGKLLVFEAQQGPTDADPPFNFEWTGTSIATLSLPGLEVQEVEPTHSAANIQWGVQLVTCGDFVYIYGVESQYMHVARVRVGHVADPRAWSFWTGTSWSKDSASSARATDDVGASYAVVHRNGYYLLVSAKYGLNQPIYVSTSTSPVGPFTGKRIVYSPPENAQPGMYAYNVAAHPQLGGKNTLVLSYNVNAWSIDGIYANANANRPRFVDLTVR